MFVSRARVPLSQWKRWDEVHSIEEELVASPPDTTYVTVQVKHLPVVGFFDWKKEKSLPCDSTNPAALVRHMQLMAGGFPMHPVAKSTSLPEVHFPWLCWDEWVVIPVRVRDIPSTAQLVRGRVGGLVCFTGNRNRTIPCAIFHISSSRLWTWAVPGMEMRVD